MSQVKVGAPVPDFMLPASNGQNVSLSDFKGKNVVIYFYPKDMTPGCTMEACDFRDYHPQFEALQTAVIGISPDSFSSHEKFIAKHQLPFLLLSDEGHQVAKMFGVWKLKNNFGRAQMGIERSTFLLDAEGKLIREWRGVKVKGHVEEVLAAVKELS